VIGKHRERARAVAVARRVVMVAALSAVASDDGTAIAAPDDDASTAAAPASPVRDLAWFAGLATIDITPEHPVRLSGYGNRREEATDIESRIVAQALALGDRRDHPFVLVAVENCGVPATVVEEVARRLDARFAIARERFTLASSHTHSAPMLTGALETLFGEPIPVAHRANIDRYTRDLVERLEAVATRAIDAMAPGALAFGSGRATFAANRRTPGGPVDHDLPVLRVESPPGELRAIVAGYACHCTALGGDFNRVAGDWSGCAREAIERAYPGVTAIVTIGCGADADPQPRTGLEHARRHGQEIADEVARVIAMPLRPLTAGLRGQFRRIALPFEDLPSRAEWQRRAALGGAVGHHARGWLERLDRGEEPPTAIDYPIGTWSFGDELTLVFLAGEVVVDYALRLDRELDRERLWITAYANDVPCYIPSRRVHAEGGYEGGDAMVYYDRPARLAVDVEDRIVDTVHAMVPSPLRSPDTNAEFPPPLAPEESLRALATRPGLYVELVAHEPLVVDPIAVDFGLDGRVWVVEMRDYPSGIDGAGKPGGRIKILEDADGDGRLDRATVFLDAVPFPTGVLEWRGGALVCAAPDILYAVDDDGDRRADRVETLFSGFETGNYQARVNGLSWGLDGRVYGAAGLFGARVRCARSGATVELLRSDFSFDPDIGDFAPAAGLSQQGRPRDDFGNWFGNENWFLLRHYPLADRYVARNPHVASPNPRVDVPIGDDPHRLSPLSRTLRRFNDPSHAGRVTSACGPTIYRDRILGDDLRGDAFICEPVHNLVHRLALEPRGVSFAGARAPDEAESEFLASTDAWFRPVQAITAPDGSLWIVDMYRFVIEHPRWIPAERLALLDVRAGAERGRIYRIVPGDAPLRRVENLATLADAELARRIVSPNGVVRDLVHRELAHRAPRGASLGAIVATLIDASVNDDDPAVRVQAAAALATLEALDDATLLRALGDRDARVRAHALGLVEKRPTIDGAIAPRLAELAADGDPRVRFALALALGERREPAAARLLAALAATALDDPWLRAAVLSSCVPHAATVLAHAVRKIQPTPERARFVADLVATSAATARTEDLATIVDALVDDPDRRSRFVVAAGVLAAFARRAGSAELPASKTAVELPADDRAALDLVLADAHAAALDASLDENLRLAAIALLAPAPSRESPRDRTIGDGAAHPADASAPDTLARLLDARESTAVQTAAVDALTRRTERGVGVHIVGALSRLSPGPRAEALEALASRPAWLEALLDALDAGQVGAGTIDAALRARLLRHDDPALRERATTALAVGRDPTRAEALAEFESALSIAGSEERGALVFARLCASCHAFRGQGHAVGADLAALTDRSPEALLVATIDPNRAVEGKYQSYDVVSRDGRVIQGVLADETTTTLGVITATGARVDVLRRDVLRVESSGLSLMPEGLERGLDPAALADVIAYLRGGPRPFGSETPDEVAAARARWRDGDTSGFAALESAAESLPHRSWFGRVPLHLCRQTDGASRVAWTTAPAPDPLGDDEARTFVLPAAMGFLGQPAGGFTLAIDGVDVLEFDVRIDDASWQSADGRVAMVWTVRQRDAEDAVGVLAITVARDLLRTSEPLRVTVRGAASTSQRWFGILDARTNERLDGK